MKARYWHVNPRGERIELPYPLVRETSSEHHWRTHPHDGSDPLDLLLRAEELAAEENIDRHTALNLLTGASL